MIKDATLEPNAQRYRGFSFNHSKATFDIEKMAAQAQNMPNGQDLMKSLVGESMKYSPAGSERSTLRMTRASAVAREPM